MAPIASPPGSSPLGKIRLALLFGVMFTTATGNTALQSLLPATGSMLGVSDVLVSAAVSWSAFLWAFSAPRWSGLSRRRGRRFLMKMGLGGFIASMALCGGTLLIGLLGWVSGVVAFAFFIVFRSLYGLFGSAAPPAVQAYMAARTPPEARTQKLALFASATGLGTVIGPAVAPWLILPGLGAPSALLMFAIIGLVMLFALQFGLPSDAPRFEAEGNEESEPLAAMSGTSTLLAERRQRVGPGGAETHVHVRWTDRRIRDWMLAGLVSNHGQALLMGVLGFLILDRLNLRATPEAAFHPTGLALTTGAIATLFVQWGLFPLLKPRPRTAIICGSLIVSVGAAILMDASSIYAIAAGFALTSLGIGFVRPGFVSGASIAVSEEEQDSVAGKVASVNGIAWIFAPAIGVAIYGMVPSLFFAVVIATGVFGALWGWLRIPVDSASVAE